MSRLVSKRRVVSKDVLPGASSLPGGGGKPFEDYLERIVKYVPVEIIAAYMAIRGFLPAHGTDGAIPAWAEIAIYVALIGLTPLYLLKVAGDAPDKGRQLGIATVSFVVWSYAIGGPFFWKAVSSLAGDAEIVHKGLAGALVVIWSLAAGLVRPREE